MNALRVQMFFQLGDLNELENRRRMRQLRIERVLIRQRSIYWLSDGEFKNNFRIGKHTFERILHELTPHLTNMNRSDGISVEKKVFMLLKFIYWQLNRYWNTSSILCLFTTGCCNNKIPCLKLLPKRCRQWLYNWTITTCCQ